MQLLLIWNVILSILRSQNLFHSTEIDLGSQNWQYDITYQMGNNCNMTFIQVNFVDQKGETVPYWRQPWVSWGKMFTLSDIFNKNNALFGPKLCSLCFAQLWLRLFSQSIAFLICRYHDIVPLVYFVLHTNENLFYT